MNYPQAVSYPGPAWKRRGTMTQRGVVNHSAEGHASGLLLEIRNNNRVEAWHFSVMKSGRVYQHYPIDVALAHAANAWGNANLVGIEHEGFAGEPLTDAQRESSVALVRWLAEQGGYGLERRVTLWEHRELSDTGTQCPSGRIPWEHYTELSAPLTVSDIGTLYREVMPGLPSFMRPVGTQVIRKPRRNNRRVYEVELP